MNHQTFGDRLFGLLNAGCLALVAFIVLYPLYFVLIASVSDAAAVLNGDVWLLPEGLHFEAYLKILGQNELMHGYGNTILYTVLGTAVNIVMTVLAAYPLSRPQLFGRNVITAMMVFTMFFSGGLIPTYLLVKQLGMLDTVWALVVPGAVSVYNIIIMRTFFQTGIPKEVQEAALIDGCNDFHILRKIVLPLSMPIIAVMILLYSVGHWNSYFSALIYLSDRSMYPLQLFLRELLVLNQTFETIAYFDEDITKRMMEAESIKYAAVIVANLPVLLLYPFLQKYFAKGMLVGAIKG
ncbi:carbohydrate ABC transporter permease [Paenibacillus flagellatus]|uniref:Sugar ABC transporter permease n=1 Tax=Paenibacillus flagellatus TaxID=2211139 RepID=A0A2V5KDM4_9BACL|nr:carbohydrate ABC transporter permease [Paenibacillus flagellatus]PYI56324.1 sugar ABC transporter permease [Paenibacillus flagellatus]